jgi:hypothetical protein
MKKDPIIFRKFVRVSVANEYAEGPEVAYVELTAKDIKRIRRLAKAIKTLKVTYIEEWGLPTELRKEDPDCPITEVPFEVTDETPVTELPLLINDENPVTAILAKRRMAGDSVDSKQTYDELLALLPEWDGRSECDFMKISEYGCHYRGYIKHTDDAWSTDSISLDELPETK